MPEFDQQLILDIVARFAIDVTAMVLLVFGLYYRRYGDKELVIAAAMFNVFAFVLLTVLSYVEFGIAVGFGLFAILAMFTLRSEEMRKTEITYLFGSIALAVICAVQGTTLVFVGIVVLLALIAAYVIDHPKVLASIRSVRVTLDRIDPAALSDAAAMQAELGRRLGVAVTKFEITSIDYINEEARLRVYYRSTPQTKAK
jgi:hypothetical protein